MTMEEIKDGFKIFQNHHPQSKSIPSVCLLGWNIVNAIGLPEDVQAFYPAGSCRLVFIYLAKDGRQIYVTSWYQDDLSFAIFNQPKGTDKISISIRKEDSSDSYWNTFNMNEVIKEFKRLRDE